MTKNECDHDDTIWNKQSRFSSTYRFYYYINCDTFGYSHDDIRNISNTYLSKYLNKELRTMISKYKSNTHSRYTNDSRGLNALKNIVSFSITPPCTNLFIEMVYCKLMREVMRQYSYRQILISNYQNE